MKKIIGLFFSSLIVLTATAETETPKKIPQREVEIINDLYFQMQEIKPIESINFDARVDMNLDEYVRCRKSFQTTYAELIKENPEIDSVPYMVNGRPLAEMIKETNDLIAKNDAFISAAIKDRPNEEAITEIDMAIFFGSAAVSLIERGESFREISDLYDLYAERKENAVKLDKRVLELRKEKLDALEKKLVEPFQKLKQQHDEEEKAKQDELDSARKQQMAAVAEKFKKKVDYAKSQGFSDGAREGFFILLDEFKSGVTSPDEVKKTLFYPLISDDFTVQNITSGFVFYINEDLQQIAVVRKSGVVYAQGSELQDGPYMFLRMDDFTTVSGAGIQLPVFSRYGTGE